MALGAFDEELFRWMNAVGNPVLDPLAIVLGVAGLILFALAWAVPLWLRDRRRDAVDLAVLLLVDAAIVTALKAAVGVARPDGVVLAIPFDDLSDASFPSGHTSRAFAAAFLLSQRLGDRRWAAALYAYAAAMGLSRVYAGAHWPSDVLAGVLVGTVLAAALERLMRHPAYANRRDRLLAVLRRNRPEVTPSPPTRREGSG